MKHLGRHLEMFKGIYQHCADVRYSGSAALNLAYVASGKLDGYWQSDIKEWDMAAGILMVQEAGGIVTDYKGAPDFSMGNIVAGTPKMHGILLDHITNADLASAL
jgi:myo-inositol-1(or 4)-monophosphatase